MYIAKCNRIDTIFRIVKKPDLNFRAPNTHASTQSNYSGKYRFSYMKTYLSTA